MSPAPQRLWRRGIVSCSWATRVLTAILSASGSSHEELRPVFRLDPIASTRSVIQRRATENAIWWRTLFEKLKRFRRIATRYDKLQESFFGFVCLAAAIISLK